MLGRFSMHYPSFRNSVLFWVMIVLLLSFLIFFRRFFYFKLRILVVTSSCFWTRGNKMVWLICFKVFFFIILLHDWNPRTEMASVICDINLLVTRKLVFQKIMWCYFGCVFFQRDIIWCGLSIRRHLCFALRSTQRISGYYSMWFIELDCYIHVLCFDNEDNNCFIPA